MYGLFIAIGLILSFAFADESMVDGKTWVVKLLRVIGIACAITLAVLWYLPPVSTNDTLNLVALSNHTQTQGQFFLGSGQIGSQSVVTFAYQATPVITKLATVPVDNNTEFIFTDEAPKAIRHEKYKQGFRDFGEVWYTFYIPKGSIAQQYNVDVSK